MFSIENQTQLSILKEIWINNVFTRTHIKEKLNINKSTVTRNFDSMINQNIFFEEGIKAPGETGGRKTQIFMLNKDLVYFVSMAVINGKILAILENMCGEKIYTLESEFVLECEENLINEIINTIKCIKEKYEDKFDKVLSINIAVPGIVDSDMGIIKYSSDLDVKNLNIKKIIEDEFETYCMIENDANAAAASSLFKSKFTYNNLLYFLFFLPGNLLSLGGIGAGIVIKNEIYKGNYSAAGEVRVKNYWMLSKNSEIDNFQLETADESILENDDDIKNYINNFSERIAGVIHFMDPKKVILGGDIKYFSDYMREYTVKKIESFYSSGQGKNFIEIDYSGLEAVANGSTVSFLINLMNDMDFCKNVLG